MIENVAVPSAAHRARRLIGALAALLTVAAMSLLALPDGTAHAASVADRVDLRVLVLNDGGANTTAIATALGRQGVPVTTVDLSSAGRPVIDQAYLENAATHEGYFQAVVLPGPTAVSATELAALNAYEREFGVRQVDTFVYPSATVGLDTPSYSGILDGDTVTATPAGLGGPYSYLSGSLTVDDFSPTTTEVFGYIATPTANLPAGQSYTSLLNVTHAGSTGSLVGLYTHDGHDEIVVTAAFNANQQYFLEIAQGIVTAATRGIHLGYQRNFLSIEVDDVFLADSRWSTVGHCTPGDDCFGTSSTLTTPDIRMTADDVSALVAWQKANDFAFDMIFNGGGSDDQVANTGSDPVATAYAANASNFQFIDHTYSHAYLGCIQVAPLVAGETWHCATQADENDPSTVYIEPELVTPTAQTYDPASGFYFASKTTIENQVTQNLAWAAAHGIPTDATQIVTGEHSGLAILPQQPMDNPNLAPALTDLGITALAADASRETASRQVGPAVTAPRHPINIFYNVSTYSDEVDEYNYLYSSVADGGSGVCTAHPDTTTCITPLPDATAADALNSWNSYIKPNEVHNALSFVLANDPRSFYVHQSNLAEQRIMLDYTSSLLAAYRSVYNATTEPLVHLDLHGQADMLAKQSNWNAQSGQVTAYLDRTGVHLQGAGSASVPLTVPTGTTLNGISLDSYGGEQSGWISQPAGDTVVAVPTTPSGGYVGVPDAPVIGTATAGNAAATVNWNPSASDPAAPVTGYLVQGYLAGATVPSVSQTFGADATSGTITGLLNFASYTFTVSAVNSVGTSAPSAQSNAVVPVASTPAAPAAPTATPGVGSATVKWSAPADGGTPITGYTVKAYLGGAASYSLSTTTAADVTTATMTGLTGGASYTFTVTATNAVGVGAESAKSAAVTVTPTVILPGAPKIGTAATAATQAARVTWTAPTAIAGQQAITGYTVHGYAAGSTTATVTATAAVRATTVTVTGLSAGVSYTFDVSATSAGGNGPASAKSNAVVATGVAAAPTITSTTVSQRTVTLKWAAPMNTGGLKITGWKVRRYNGSTATVVATTNYAATATSATFTLAVGTTASFDVAAVNSAGTGAYSARSTTVTAVTTPTAPRVVAATAGKATASVTWAAPTSTGGTPLTGYVVTATKYLVGIPLASTESTVLDPATTSLDMALPAGRYRFTIVAQNAVGTGRTSTRSAVVVVS